MLNILYLVHDLCDPAVSRRVAMLQAGGASITLAGFRRTGAIPRFEGITPIELGETADRAFAQRLVAVAKAAFSLAAKLGGVTRPDVIIGRNLEMLALANRARAIFGAEIPVVYECLDIHRLLLNQGLVGKAMRAAERLLSRNVALLLTSSPAFVRDYFEAYRQLRAPVVLLQNKILELSEKPAAHTKFARPPQDGEPWKIGWFGALRCRKSLELLAGFTRHMQGRFEVVLRGRPSHVEFDDFEGFVAAEPYMRFEGAYRNPEDLASIYGDVHFSWAIDFFEEGLNSSWLLPNRLYEGCRFGAVPVAMKGTETARFLADRRLGLLLDEPSVENLAAALGGIDAETYGAMRRQVALQDPGTWICGPADCRALVDRLASLGGGRQKRRLAGGREINTAESEHLERPARSAAGMRCMVVIPCLNEVDHIGALLDQLLDPAERLDMKIVVVDGGSTDGTRATVREFAATQPRILLLDNPRRLQSAAVNLAVATHGDMFDCFIRIDAHGGYPDDYCDRLLEEAASTGADSVVVSMATMGFGAFQKATAAAQNSKLGNGGSPHREGTRGHWTDHGHHALMRIEAFRAIGGYDEDFSHNEDAELDYRLTGAGYGIWMTDKTVMTYYPRSSASTLFRQYLGYGRGRAKNVLKHRMQLKARQAMPLLVFPVVLGMSLAFLSLSALVPAGLWMAACFGYGVWMAVVQRNPYGPLAGLSAMIMHLAWSMGFWLQMLESWRKREAAAS